MAELQTSRSFDRTFSEAYILRFSPAANAQVAGWWKGGLLGLVSSLPTAACFDGVKFDGYPVDHKGWGLYHHAWPARRTGALRDVAGLLAWLLGARPVRVIGTQTQISPVWPINYLPSSSAQLPRGPAGPPPPRSSSGRGAAMADGPPATEGTSKLQRRESSRDS